MATSFCRLRSIQSICEECNLDCIVVIPGQDGSFNPSTQSLVKFAFLGESGLNVVEPTISQSKESIEDCVFVIAPECLRVLWREDVDMEGKIKLFRKREEWKVLLEDLDDASVSELYKIRSFIEMINGCKKVGVPLTPGWTRGQHEISRNILTEGTRDPTEVEDISEKIIELFSKLDSLAIETCLTSSRQMTNNHWSDVVSIMNSTSRRESLTADVIAEPLLSFYTFGMIQQQVAQFASPLWPPARATLGKCTDYDYLGANEQRDIDIFTADSSLHIVIEAEDPDTGVRASRTYFLRLGSTFDPTIEDIIFFEEDEGSLASKPKSSDISSINQPLHHDSVLLMQIYASLIRCMNAVEKTSHITLEYVLQETKRHILNAMRSSCIDIEEAVVSTIINNIDIHIDAFDSLKRPKDYNSDNRCYVFVRLAVCRIPSIMNKGEILGTVVFADTFLQLSKTDIQFLPFVQLDITIEPSITSWSSWTKSQSWPHESNESNKFRITDPLLFMTWPCERNEEDNMTSLGRRLQDPRIIADVLRLTISRISPPQEVDAENKLAETTDNEEVYLSGTGWAGGDAMQNNESIYNHRDDEEQDELVAAANAAAIASALSPVVFPHVYLLLPDGQVLPLVQLSLRIYEAGFVGCHSGLGYIAVRFEQDVVGVELLDAEDSETPAVMQIKLQPTHLNFGPLQIVEDTQTIALVFDKVSNAKHTFLSQVLPIWKRSLNIFDIPFNIAKEESASLFVKTFERGFSAFAKGKIRDSGDIKKEIPVKTLLQLCEYVDLHTSSRLEQFGYNEPCFGIQNHSDPSKAVVGIHIVIGVPGSGAEEFSKYATQLHSTFIGCVAVSSRWVVKDGVGVPAEGSLAQFSRESVLAPIEQALFALQEKNVSTNPQLLLCCNGYVDPADIIACLYQDPSVREKISIESITTCLSTHCLYRGSRHTQFLPCILQQCSMGWTNTIIVLEGGKRPSSAVGVRPSSNALMQLLQSSNPLASIIRLNSGLSSLGLSDISAIFKCGQFFSKEMKEARSVFTPVWWEKVTEPIVQCSTATGFVESKLVHIKHAVDRSKFVAIMKDLTREKIDTAAAFPDRLMTDSDCWYAEAVVVFSDDSFPMPYIVTSTNGVVRVKEIFEGNKRTQSTESQDPEARLTDYVSSMSVSILPGLPIDSTKLSWVLFVGVNVSQAVENVSNQLNELGPRLLTRGCLDDQTIRAVNERQKAFPTPESYYWDGNRYIDMMGRSRDLHPLIDRFIAEYIEEENAKISRYYFEETIPEFEESMQQDGESVENFETKQEFSIEKCPLPVHMTSSNSIQHSTNIEIDTKSEYFDDLEEKEY